MHGLTYLTQVGPTGGTFPARIPLHPSRANQRHYDVHNAKCSRSTQELRANHILIAAANRMSFGTHTDTIALISIVDDLRGLADVTFAPTLSIQGHDVLSWVIMFAAT